MLLVSLSFECRIFANKSYSPIGLQSPSLHMTRQAFLLQFRIICNEVLEGPSVSRCAPHVFGHNADQQVPLLAYVLIIMTNIMLCIEGRGEKDVNACVCSVKVLLSRIQWSYTRMTQDISVRSYVVLRSCKHCFILPTSINISDNHRLHHRRLSVGIELCSRPNHHTFYVYLNVIYITALWFCDV